MENSFIITNVLGSTDKQYNALERKYTKPFSERIVQNYREEKLKSKRKIRLLEDIPQGEESTITREELDKQVKKKMFQLVLVLIIFTIIWIIFITLIVMYLRQQGRGYGIIVNKDKT